MISCKSLLRPAFRVKAPSLSSEKSALHAYRKTCSKYLGGRQREGERIRRWGRWSVGGGRRYREFVGIRKSRVGQLKGSNPPCSSLVTEPHLYSAFHIHPTAQPHGPLSPPRPPFLIFALLPAGASQVVAAAEQTPPVGTQMAKGGQKSPCSRYHIMPTGGSLEGQ